MPSSPGTSDRLRLRESPGQNGRELAPATSAAADMCLRKSRLEFMVFPRAKARETL